MTEPDAVELILRPALPQPVAPVWDGAFWIGEVWIDAIDSAARNGSAAGVPIRVLLAASEGYGRARILVRNARQVLGFVEVAVSTGNVDFAELSREVADLRATSAAPVEHAGSRADESEPAIDVTVVVCTRDRVDMLRTALESILAMDYPCFEVFVVDNAPTTADTRDYILGLEDPRVRLVEEPRPGLSRARNAGLLAASTHVVAFTDDDVIVDRLWLRTLLDGFAQGTLVSCVSGSAPAAEIRTPAQAYFDGRVGWSDSFDMRFFEWSRRPNDVPLYPFAVRCYGTGANFAVERDAVLRIGGFDENLGAGTPTGGGEDIDMFFRILRSGRQLVHDPAAIVWHRHRADSDALLQQTRSYGVGLGAWLAKIMSEPATARLAVKTVLTRGPAFVRHMLAASDEATPTTAVEQHLPEGVGDSTWPAMIKGARLYLSVRRTDRSAKL